MEILLLTTLGFVLVLVDILVVPGSLLVAVGSGVILYSVYLNYLENGPWVAGLHLLLCLATLPKLVIWGFQRLSLKGEMRNRDGYIGVEDRRAFVGLRGVTQSPLRPSGSVSILVDGEEEYLDCISDGDYIESGVEVEVIEDRGTSLVVRAIGETDTEGSGDPASAREM